MEDLDKTKYEADLAAAETDEQKKNITLEFEAQEMKLRRRSLGNIRFIGELYKISMLNGKIMHDCIRRLLKETDEESLECLCRLVTTVGQVRHILNTLMSLRASIYHFDTLCCRARGPVQRSHPSQSHRSKNISPFRENGPGVDIKITHAPTHPTRKLLRAEMDTRAYSKTFLLRGDFFKTQAFKSYSQIS